MVLDTSLHNTQHYKVSIKGKVEQSRKKSNALLLHLDIVAIEKESLLIALDYGCQLYLLIGVWMCVKLCDGVCRFTKIKQMLMARSHRVTHTSGLESHLTLVSN